MIREKVLAGAVAATFLALAPLRLWSQVQIFRELPQTGENQAQAQWRPPLPFIGAPGRPEGFQVQGRIAVGTSGGLNESGAQSFDAVVESNLSLLAPLGLSSSFGLTASALRKPALNGLEQSYKGQTNLTFERWQAEAGGSFRQQAKSEPTVSSNDVSSDAHAALTIGLMPTLPISASYSYQRLDQSLSDTAGASSELKDAGTHQASLKAVGTLGQIGVDAGANFSDITDYSQEVRTTAFGGSLAMTVPIGSFLKAYATLLPKYNATAYSQTGNSAATTSLESGAGIIIPVSEPLSFRIGGGRIDQWSEQAGPSAYADPTTPAYSATWKGTAGIDLKKEVGVNASGSYSLGKTVSGPIIHGVDASVGYLGGEGGAVREATIGGSYSISLDDAGSPVADQGTWKAVVSLGSQESLALNASYSGSVSDIPEITMTHAAHATLSHQVSPALSYAAGADLVNSMGSASSPTFTQTYTAKLTVAPMIAARKVSFSVDEALALDVLENPPVIVSRAGAGVEVPLLSFLSTRYRLEWEWDSQTAPAAAAGSAFRNALGLTAGGRELPFSFAAEYALTSGFRGLRHDVTASVTAPFRGGFGLQGSLTLSEYESGGAPTTPFLAIFSASYEF